MTSQNKKTFPKILWISKLFWPLFGQLNEKYLPLGSVSDCFRYSNPFLDTLYVHTCCFLLICNSCKSLSLDTSDTCRLGWCIDVFGEDTVESIKDLSPALAILWLLDNVLLWPKRINNKYSEKKNKIHFQKLVLIHMHGSKGGTLGEIEFVNSV